MDAPLNLTPARGPSVWDKPQQTVEPWRVAAVTTGIVLLGAAFPYRSRASQIRGGLGLLSLAVGVRGDDRVGAAIDAVRRWLTENQKVEQLVDQTLEESFPASDPPAH